MLPSSPCLVAFVAWTGLVSTACVRAPASIAVAVQSAHSLNTTSSDAVNGTTIQAVPASPVLASVSYPINITSTNPPLGKKYVRDSGWLGTVGTRIFTMNFDTSVCDLDAADCALVASNSLTDATFDPTMVQDPSDAMNLCNTEDQIGWVTNVWGVNETHGIGYYLNITHHLLSGLETGQGSSPVILDFSSNATGTTGSTGTTSPVTCTRVHDAVNFWTPGTNHAIYGNGGTVNASDGYLYVYAPQDGSLFLARVPFDVDSASDLAAYTYWNGEAFVSDEREAVSILSTLGGSISYSNYYHKFMWLTQGLGYSGVYAYLADSPQGPFSNGTLLFTDAARGGTYAPYAQTQYDESGKTVHIVYSVVDNLSQRVVTVTWE